MPCSSRCPIKPLVGTPLLQYTVFGEVTFGLDTLSKLETLETRKEGIFVMPLNRIEIRSTYM